MAAGSTTPRSTSSARSELARDQGALIYGVAGSPDETLAELAEVAVIVEPPGDLKALLMESFRPWFGARDPAALNEVYVSYFAAQPTGADGDRRRAPLRTSQQGALE